MTNKSARQVSIQKEKKLIKELKNSLKVSSEKLLTLFMKQKVHEITVKDILESSINVHKMMFQNLSSELCKNINDDKIVQISSTVIDNKKKSSELSIL